jgi:hypothetical protein
MWWHFASALSPHAWPWVACAAAVAAAVPASASVAAPYFASAVPASAAAAAAAAAAAPTLALARPARQKCQQQKGWRQLPQSRARVHHAHVLLEVLLEEQIVRKQGRY